ncbi:MAG: hypothetical protein KAS12_06680 [Candidatus Aenigmarchaeota archaeon]|nr:hypothetical protein [Candidatus Aenigmarchaeota archaeon]
MKLGSKNIEWLFVVILIILAISQFLIMTGGIMTSSFQFTLMNMFLLMIFGGQLVVGILLLRIYDAILANKKM